MDTQERIEGEKRVLAVLCNLILANDYKLIVYDGGDMHVCHQTCEALEHIFSVDESWIIMRQHLTGNLLGEFYIVLGNSPAEVIADCTTNETTRRISDVVDAFIDDNFPG